MNPEYPASGRVVVNVHHGEGAVIIWQPHLRTSEITAEVEADLAAQAHVLLTRLLTRYAHAQADKERVRRFSELLKDGRA